jgi:hypothetical protein
MATMRHQVWIDAPIAKVHSALATAEGLSGWWAPHTSTETADGVLLAHSPGPQHGDVQMLVLDSTPKRIEWKIVSTHPKKSPASAWTGTHIIFELKEKPSPGQWMGLENEGKMMTVVDFSHSGWDEGSEFFGFCNYAWGVTLDLLRKSCEGFQ